MNDKKLSGSLTITDGQDKSQIPDVPRPLLEALYATVTNAKDMLSQKRRLASIVEIDDIEQLVAQLDQWSQPYDPISRKIQISVNSFSPEEVQVGVKRSQYGSLEEFRRELPGKTDQISSITLIFDFLARNEKDSLTNQCELTVEIRGGVQRVFYSVSSTNQLGGRLYRNSDEWSASFSIRYSDVIVARGLLGVVDDWYQNLPKREFPALGKFRLFLHRADEFDEYDLTK